MTCKFCGECDECNVKESNVLLCPLGKGHQYLCRYYVCEHRFKFPTVIELWRNEQNKTFVVKIEANDERDRLNTVIAIFSARDTFPMCADHMKIEGNSVYIKFNNGYIKGELK